jgi:DNA gyrase subunit A
MLDGLKPVHRRVLLNASELTQDRPTKSLQELSVLESITHMEILLYMTMVRMAQEWSMRYLLIDGQGNFRGLLMETVQQRCVIQKECKISEEI